MCPYCGSGEEMAEHLLSCPRWAVEHQRCCCCCCDSPAALLLSSVVQVEEVCDHGRVVPQVLHCELHRMALTVEQMLCGVWCHSTLRTDIWYAAGDAGLATVQKPTVTRMQLGESGTDWARQQTFKRWDVGWWSSKDSVWYKIRFCFYDCSRVFYQIIIQGQKRKIIIEKSWQTASFWWLYWHHRCILGLCESGGIPYLVWGDRTALWACHNNNIHK